ncbi:Assimilatory nitrate reductase catalytic subunit [Pirellula sp. SH-Sr6A]|uniref:molybdopterin-containing oxidoreductase family protein n=1 Tax=Pirellula sp. SH-Sr6A TaxID=1632865 RepID=UPI00078EF39B|nr:molybdopterin-dependent oxidoreductase [Pirellula sp. SH-Sr6A]AMV31909.1 Assimilatory nitrate reductase catalytic subunit [Pirellula sp. SH-Sr6A]
MPLTVLPSTTQVLPSVCALDCPDACSLRITVENGKVTKLAGDPDHPITQGFACVKMARYPERQEQADRLLYPMKRVGEKGEGRFERISWEQAIEEIARRTGQILASAGGDSILPYHYAGTMGVIEGQMPLAFFRRIGAVELDQTICAATGGTAWEMNYGPNKLSTDPEDLIHARYVVLWGINALRSNSHLAPVLKIARQNGARILHIDPYRNETSRFADEHWQIRVGTDTALALAIANEIFRNGWEDVDYLNRFAHGIEEFRRACEPWTLERASEYCDIPLENLTRMVRAFATSAAPFIKVGYGMTRNESGGNAIRAVTLLPALVGAWKKLGGGAALSTSGAFGLHTAAVNGNGDYPPSSRHVNMNLLASELTAEPTRVHGLFVFNSNPAAVAPDSSRVRRGLAREDLFTVVLEHFQTDTADFADYLLPATTFLEHHDVYTSYGHYYLQYSEPVVAPRGEARPNSWIFRKIAGAMDIEVRPFEMDRDQILKALLASSNPWLAGIDAERLKSEKSIKLQFPSEFRPYADGSHFPDRKIRFSPPPAQLEFEEQLSDSFPLRLISPPGSHILNTSMGNVASILKLAGGEPQMVIHPADALARGIVDGERATVSSPTGSIVRRVRVSDEAKEGVVVALGQWWPKLAPDRKSLNDITSERLTDLGGGSTFGNVAVQVTRMEPSRLQLEK